jgi:hypothetical protein
MNALFSSSNSLVKVWFHFVRTPVLLSALAAVTAQADWPNPNSQTKYQQQPDRTAGGYDVLAARPPAALGDRPIMVADDFPCNTTGPITDIHIWASWLGDTATLNIPDVTITVGFWSDVPASPGNPSHPGTLLWVQKFLPGGAIPGHYKKVPAGWAPQSFWDPDPPPLGNIMGVDNIMWQYNFYPDPSQPNGFFMQMGTAAFPTNYWLSVTAGTNVVTFGWKTSNDHHGDDAVYGNLNPNGELDPNGNPPGGWHELFDPVIPTKSLDMAFAVTTTPDQPPPPPPPDKWVQYPDLLSGFGLDVNATVPNPANGLVTLADDFRCIAAGPITNIQLWASFKDDAPPGANTFVVSIWSDSAKGATGFSHPLQRLWTQTYGPADYTRVPAGAGVEHFYDPATGQLTPETMAWLYSFDLFPTNPFCQQGNGAVYWVSVASISPSAAFVQWGWKTTQTNHWNDAGVSGRVDPITGNLLTAWQPVFNPLIVGIVPAPVDFAFRIRSGPPSADCDPALSGVIQPPDTSTNGLDVWALTPTVLGDDFPCKVSGPIGGITIWGSWLGDQVDTNAQFELKLWTDVPKATGANTFSHPGSMLCDLIFSPPQSAAGPLRYTYSLFRSNVQETFYNPNLPGNTGLIGNDTQIWRYNFYPPPGSCFFQDGGGFNNKLFWVTLTYLPGTAGNPSSNVFGWKTSTRHFQDAAVYGTNGLAWNVLSDPRNGTLLDLAKVIWKFRVVGKNEDIFNLTPATADSIRLILNGTHLVTWHYDDAPPWFFSTYPTNIGSGTYTVLQWYGRTIPSGGVTHVGYLTPGTVLPTVFSMDWLNGTNIIGSVVQENYHLLGDPTAVELNDFFPGTLVHADPSVEFYATPPPLDQMIVGGTRSPLATMPMQGPGPINTGGAAVMLNPQPFPPGARYEIIIVALNNDVGMPGARDFVLLPLDTVLAPGIQSINISGGNVILHIDSDIGRSYQLQSVSALGPQPLPWTNMGDPVMATGADTILSAPVSGAQAFYRVMLMP